jgi:Tol biopolymer transport system component
MAAWDEGQRDGGHIYLNTTAGTRQLYHAAEPLVVDSWWPDGQGLLIRHLWGYCNSCNADGVRLASVTLDGRFTDLGNFHPQAGTYAWSPRGDLLLGTGGDRFVVTGDPTVFVCSVSAGSCAEIPRPPGNLDLTPAWSSDGKFIVFARGIKPDGITEVGTWQDSLEIWIARADGSGQKRLQTPGGSYPTWSDDGRSVTFIHAGQRWRHDLYSGESVATAEMPPGIPGRGWVTYPAVTSR